MRVGWGFQGLGCYSQGRWDFGAKGRRRLRRRKGVGEMVKGLTYAVVGGRHGKEDVVAAVVVDGRGEVKGPSPMFCP